MFSSFTEYLLFLDKNILWRTFTPRWWNSLHLRGIWLFWCSRQGWQMDSDFHGKRRHDNPPCWHISPIHTGWERMLLWITINFCDKSMWIYITLVTTCPETCSSLAKHIKYEGGEWKILNNSQHLNLSSPGHKFSFSFSAVIVSHCHVMSLAQQVLSCPSHNCPSCRLRWTRCRWILLCCLVCFCGDRRACLCPTVTFFTSVSFTFGKEGFKGPEPLLITTVC